jgi:hypothetical protein
VEIGERTRAEPPVVHNGRRFLLNRGALVARRMGRAAVDRDDDVEAFDCCGFINLLSLGLEGQQKVSLVDDVCEGW